MAPMATAVGICRPLFNRLKQCVSCSASPQASGNWKRNHASMTDGLPTSGSSIERYAGEALIAAQPLSSIGKAAVAGVRVARKPKQQVELLGTLVPSLMAAIIALSPLCNPPVSLGQTVDIQRGAALFRRACIGCHDAGGNIIQPGATLFLKDLQRNGVDTEEEIYKVTYFGKGRMPGFGENCTPRGQCTFGPRLQDEDIKVLADFVKVQADQGWPNMDMISQD